MHDSMYDLIHLSTRHVRIPALRGVAVFFLMLALATAPAAAAEWQSKQEMTAGKPGLAKVSSHLLRARQLAASGKLAAEIASAVPSVKMSNGLLVVDVSLFRLDQQILDALRQRGLLVDSYNFTYAHAYGRIDPARLADVAAHAEVSTIHPMPRARRRVGAVTGQGDATVNADDVRGTFGYDGTGVTLGILSDTFHKTLGGTESGGTCTCGTPGSTCLNVVTGMTNQGTGDLPASIPILDDCPLCGTGSDEGAALGELISDIAPGSDLMFHSANNSPSDFASGITELSNCGADVIIDDVGWNGQPFFQDGDIAQAAQGAVDAGVSYFSAAGNDATFGINDDYTDSDPVDNTIFPNPDGKDFHDFDNGSPDTFAAITLPDDCQIFAELQWSEPFSGTLGPGASSDLDLYLLDSEVDPDSTGGANVLFASVNGQGCGVGLANSGDPLESVTYKNETGALKTVFLAVDHFCGDEAVELRIINQSFNCSTTNTAAGWDFEDGFDLVAGLPVPDATETPIFDDAQIFGHPAAKGAVAVGAAFYGEIDSGGTLDPPPGQLDIEPFSSLGGDLPFYFDGGGMPLGAGPPAPETRFKPEITGPPAPETRFKPEITGPDGTNTTFFGIDIGFDGDTDPNFFGTSASAPHAAAVAALIVDATDGNINPRALKQLLLQSTIDMEMPGPDDLSGAGFTDALRAIRSVDSTSPPLNDDLEFNLEGGAFLKLPPIPRQRLQANDTLILGDGDYSGIEGVADTIIFTDGFESGDTSSWSNSVP